MHPLKMTTVIEIHYKYLRKAKLVLGKAYA